MYAHEKVDKSTTPEEISQLRNKEQSLKIMAQIRTKTSKVEKKREMTKYGLHDAHNPLLQLDLDLYRFN